MPKPPILWSFRRCPYAMRARLAIRASSVQVTLREIVLREKPEQFLLTSPKGTVPVLDTGFQILEESRDIMIWALQQRDPGNWLDMPTEGNELIDMCDGSFKKALDRTKYAVRFPDVDEAEEREKALVFLRHLNDRLLCDAFLTGARYTLADAAVLPFIRQFANTDRAWLDSQKLDPLTKWLDAFLGSRDFAAVMEKHPPWQPGQDRVLFPS